MILPYHLVRLMHQQRLEEALRKEPELRFVREFERGRRPWDGRRPMSIASRLSRLLTGRPTRSSRDCAPSAGRNPAYLSCMDGRPDELCCRAA